MNKYSMAELINLPAQFVAMYENQSFSEWVTEFQKLDKELDNITYETRKLILLQLIENHLLTKIKTQPLPLIIEDSKATECSQALLKVGYQFCLLFGCFEKATGSFLFGSNLFVLIPGIGHFFLYALTTIYTLLDALLFYAFEVSFLKKALGVSNTNNPACLLNATYARQLKSVIEINIILHRRETYDWDAKEYGDYCNAMQIFNQHLINKHRTMGEYTSTPLRIAVEKGVVVFGAVSSVADSYFMAKTALMTLHVSFMSSPLGWLLVVGMVVAALVFYYAMGVQSMSKLVHPDRKSYNALKEGLTLFDQKYAHTVPYPLSHSENSLIPGTINRH